MDELFSPEFVRMLERIIVVIGGILSVCLGYRLFRQAHLAEVGKGKFKSAFIEITLSRVGPGLWFALFGSYILYSSLQNSVSTFRDGVIAGANTEAERLLSESVAERLDKFVAKLPAGDQTEMRALLAILRTRRESHFTGSVPQKPNLQAAPPPRSTD